MDALTRSAERLRRFGAMMQSDTPPVDVVLPELRALFGAAGTPYKLVSGLAVVHHGYPRLTVDIDVLVTRDGAAALDAQLAAHGFSRLSERRLVHDATGVRIDLLREGECLVGPRQSPPLPSPLAVAGSELAPDVVALPVLLELELDAGRRQALTDVLQLLKRLDDGRYTHVEAAVRRERRAELYALREEALEELRWESANES
ncbi:MAG: hypothetical protein HY908_37105 [Myxococcales bacterium]|nr:hypothetical protein [Myxococcales bacterium]